MSFFYGINRRPKPVNNVLIFFVFILVIYLFIFYNDRGEPFCQTVYPHYVALSL